MTSTRNLVILRAGDQSLHRGWIAGRRDFDLCISYYGSTPDRHRDDADHYEMRRGPKWPCLADLLKAHPEWLTRYDAFWFPDDDLAATTDCINRMFALFHGFELALAQPALTADSYVSWPHLIQQPGCYLRFVNFVEVMAPVFSAPSLRACLPTFSESRSGWGLDWVWPRLCGAGRDDAIAIIDAAPVKHTRPLGGDLYRNNPELDPSKDCEELLAKYDIPRLTAVAKYSDKGSVQRVLPGPIERAVHQMRVANGRRKLKRDAPR